MALSPIPPSAPVGQAPVPQRGAQPVILGDSLCLEEEDPPVSCPEVEDVGSLAVVRRPRGKRMVDANSILQLLFHQRLPWLILLLRITGRFRANLGMHPSMSQLYEAMGPAGECLQWWGWDITLYQAAAGSASSSCYTHGERLHNPGAWAWPQHSGCSPLPRSWAVCVPAGGWICHPNPSPSPEGKGPGASSLPSQAPTRSRTLSQQLLSLPRLSLSTPRNRDATRTPSDSSSRHGAKSA